MNDLRTIKTTQAIENALMELIEIKGFSKIKLTDIASKAMVNRNTIYLHYASKEDIVISILNKTYKEENFGDDFFKMLFSSPNKKSIAKLMTQLVDSIDKNIELYRILTTDPNLKGYLTHIINVFRNKTLKEIEDTNSNKIRLDYMLSGTYGAVSRWVTHAEVSREEIIGELTSITYFGLKTISKKRK